MLIVKQIEIIRGIAGNLDMDLIKNENLVFHVIAPRLR
jgi:hypothetical protein